ncbi:protein stum homolog isoform X1 [Peromyscus eremicus]|uniref:protein stum homolog isoform X1 n=1 Tax=Peromyscus eremicus TaxID=42410 RepID=UPI0027DCB587|nr:protein stum homolog isoform X1 [Peromyscus eremicus]
MEPLHKDAETAAAAAAVAAADPRGASSSSGVVVQVREKKGPLRAAIPYMPFPVAVICLFLNTFVPGLGTFVSAFTVLCGARTDLPDRHVCCVFWLNIAAALIQVLTAIVMVGWIMSIFWGMDMVILANCQMHPPISTATAFSLLLKRWMPPSHEMGWSCTKQPCLRRGSWNSPLEGNSCN